MARRRRPDHEGQINFDFDALPPDPPPPPPPPPPPDPPRPSLIDPAETRAVIKNGIARAEHLTDDHQKIGLLQAIRTAAELHPYLTADDVWEVRGEVGGGRDDGSGLGPVMLLAAKSGLIQNTGDFRRSERPPTRGKPLPVWKSLVYRAG